MTMTRPKYSKPTEPQVRVLDLLIQGYSNAEIARKLGLGEDTVKTHLKLASHSVMARNRTHLAVMYVEWKQGIREQPSWDARRREHYVACSIFKDANCDCAKRRNPTEDCGPSEG